MWAYPAARQHRLRDPAAVRARGILGPCLTTTLAAAWVWPHIPRDAAVAKPSVGQSVLGRQGSAPSRGSDPHPRGSASGRTQSSVLAASLRSRSQVHGQGLRVKFVLSH